MHAPEYIQHPNKSFGSGYTPACDGGGVLRQSRWDILPSSNLGGGCVLWQVVCSGKCQADFCSVDRIPGSFFCQKTSSSPQVIGFANMYFFCKLIPQNPKVQPLSLCHSPSNTVRSGDDRIRCIYNPLPHSKWWAPLPILLAPHIVYYCPPDSYCPPSFWLYCTLQSNPLPNLIS